MQATPDYQSAPAINFNGSAEPLEKALLSTLLDSPELYKGIAEIIEPEDFINDSARQIFAWIVYESKQGRSIDISLAMSHFSQTPRLSSYLIEVGTVFPSQDSIRRHAEELRDLSMRFSMIEMLRESSQKLLHGQLPVDQEIAVLSKSLNQTNVRLNAGGESNQSYKEVGKAWRARLAERAEKGGIPGISTGFRDLDQKTTGYHKENLIIVGGRPSMGKTTFSMNSIEDIAVNQGIPALVFSMEMPKEDLYERTIASIGGIDFENLRLGRLKAGDTEKLRIATEKLDAAPLYIDDQPALSLNQVVARATKAKRDHNIGIILIDYLQLMTVSKHFLANLNEGIGEISRGLKQLARDLKIPIVVLSQLSRELERRPDKRPMNSDLRSSGSIEQDADLILFVYRDEVYNPETEDKGVAEIIIGKQRNGPLGTVRLGFANGQSRFETIDQGGGQPTTLPKVSRTERVKHDKESISLASHHGQQAAESTPTVDSSGQELPLDPQQPYPDIPF
ncbi:replicative DNA helicase [Pseudomonas sp. S1(2024)]|uniref:replicative DNA helicase n=1 Tax=Pseudomonas sp. S1(2024) TaxID=3390191 RepID=UPI00397C1079